MAQVAFFLLSFSGPVARPIVAARAGNRGKAEGTMMDSTREQGRGESTRGMPRDPRAFGRRIDCAEREQAPLTRGAFPPRGGVREPRTWHGRAGDHRG